MTPADLATCVADVAFHLQRRVRRQDRVHGITASRLSALERIASGAPPSLGELADAEGVSPATMSRIVDGLEEGRLVARRRSAGDARVVEIVPTTLGRTLTHSIRRRRLAWLEALLTRLDDDERLVVERATEILSRTLTRGDETAKTSR